MIDQKELKRLVDQYFTFMHPDEGPDEFVMYHHDDTGYLNEDDIVDYYRNTDGTIDPNRWCVEVFTEDVITYMACEIIGRMFKFCHCGYANEMSFYINDILSLFNDENDRLNNDAVKEKIGTDMCLHIPYELKKDHSMMCFYALLHHMDAIGVITHGCSICHPWLTDKGRWARDVLNAYTKYLIGTENVNPLVSTNRIQGD